MKFIISVLLTAFVLGFAGTSYADSCASVKREMTYGRVALEGAKDKQGFIESAKQYEAAVKKAPSCAEAHFNLGLVYEKAGEYKKALNSLQQYLSLAPKASDAGQVQEKVYELEYRAQKAASSPKGKWEHLSGKWCRTTGQCEGQLTTQYWRGDLTPFDVKVSGSNIKIKFVDNSYNTGYRCRRIITDQWVGTINDSGSMRGSYESISEWTKSCAPFAVASSIVTGTFIGSLLGRGSIIEIKSEGTSDIKSGSQKATGTTSLRRKD